MYRVLSDSVGSEIRQPHEKHMVLFIPPWSSPQIKEDLL